MKLGIKLIRDMKQSAGQFLAFVLIVAVGAFFYTGLVTLSDNLSAYTKAYFQAHNISDLNVYYSQITKEEAAALSKTEGIKKLEGRYTFDATQSFEGYKTSIKVHSLPANNEINTPAVTEGALPSRLGEILLDSHYAKEHQYRVGDEIRIRTNDKSRTFTVSGLGENVEHAKKNEIQDHQTYGFAYVSEETIPLLADGFFYNEIMIDAQDGYDVDKLGKSIQDRSQSQSLPYLNQISKERTFSYSQLTATIHNNRLMSQVIPIVLFLIEAIILFLTMSRTIDSQRNQVGIMKALGVKNSSILLHYMGYPVLVGVAGSLLGFAVSAFVFVPFVTASNARSYSLPGIEFSLSVYSLLPPILFASAFGMISCYFSGRTVLKERAAQAIRPKPPKATKRILIEAVPGVWSRIPYSYKLILRNIWLNKQKALASSVGVVGSTVLLITAFGTQTALQKVANQIEKVYTYDLRVDYKVGSTANTITLPSGIANRYVLATLPVELVKENRTEKADLVVTEKENSLVHFYDDKDNRIDLEDGGVLVPKSYADKYRISEGNQIQIRFTAPELAHKTVTMKVLGISSQYSNPSFYITPSYLESFGLVYTPTSLLVAADRPADVGGIRTLFEQDPQVEAIADKTDLRKAAQYILKQNSFIFIMFIICAVVLSFGAIYTISSINIYERNRELATLKVLGYPKSKINRLIFLENSILTALAIIIALPISGYMYANVIKALSSTHQQIPDKLTISVLAISSILAFLLTVLSNLLLRRKVVRINMIESLKSVE
ncbi:ABC transporter permease [Paenibacillus ginsengarvi]|uniref:FtsX-like permease family protein n=1 Tax=Paenibacillus ginsengarvi TaxID=400777 RepID=A0A3B0CLS0_9BACL|nr:FtsX-like permease family protein [Paenibacillus ginsengarvi]RKN85688.1 FtsX-like permease family protein [Paenibacillus ginsengarvi]